MVEVQDFEALPQVPWMTLGKALEVVLHWFPICKIETNDTEPHH